MKNIFIISGPSGAGEDSLVSGIAARLPIYRIVNTTSRAMREGESQGHPYYFVTREAFEAGIANDEFIEHAQAYNGEHYGVTRAELERALETGRPAIWKMEFQGVRTVKTLYPEIPAILITAPLAVLRERIVRRDNPDPAFLEERMRYTEEWLRVAEAEQLYDYVIENKEGALEESIDEFQRLIERLRA